MTADECTILQFFRRYQTGPAQMLFFNPGDCKLPTRHFNSAMDALMARGLVIKERPNQAYSLTHHGYDVLLTIPDDSRPAGKSCALNR